MRKGCGSPDLRIYWDGYRELIRRVKDGEDADKVLADMVKSARQEPTARGAMRAWRYVKSKKREQREI